MAAVKLSSLRADTKRENDGDWVDIPDLPGVSLKVRSFNYGPYLTAKSAIDGRNQRKYFAKREDVPPAVHHRDNARLYLDHILLDWRGLAEDDGAPITIDRAEELLMNPEYRILHQAIRYAGALISETEVEFIEEAGKNSPPSSAGRSKATAAA